MFVRSFAKVVWVAITGALLLVAPSVRAWGQEAEVSKPSANGVAAVIPQQVRYAGVMPNRGGDTVEVTFRIYATAEGGEALWSETQLMPVRVHRHRVVTNLPRS